MPADSLPASSCLCPCGLWTATQPSAGQSWGVHSKCEMHPTQNYIFGGTVGEGTSSSQLSAFTRLNLISIFSVIKGLMLRKTYGVFKLGGSQLN